MYASLHVWENECHDLCIFAPPEAFTRWPKCVCVWPLVQELACLFLHKPVFVFVFLACFHASLHVMWFFHVCMCVCSPLLPVALSLCGPILSRIIASKDMHHEFLIHCIFLLSHRGKSMWPGRGQKPNSSRELCATLSGGLWQKVDVRREGMWGCAPETETQVPREKKPPRCKNKAKNSKVIFLPAPWPGEGVCCCLTVCREAFSS